MNAELYDLLILGGGPAGLSAALYASRARLRAAVLHDGGGQVTSTPEIENYLGIDSIDGFELDRLFTEHAKRMGAELLTVRAEKLTAGGYVLRGDARRTAAHEGGRSCDGRDSSRAWTGKRTASFRLRRILLRDLRRRVFPQ